MDDEAGWAVRWPDDRFWVRLADGWTPDPAIKWRIDGNAHTHRGHFHVCAVDLDLHRTVNMMDVEETSPDAQVWLAGFLNGQQVGLFEFMGSSTDLYDAASDDDIQRWRQWNAEFGRLGYEPTQVPEMPPGIPDLSDVRDPPPWAHVADQYRVWQDDAWVIADPQPTLHSGRRGWTWPGTLCESRGYHSIEQLDRVSLCEDCHRVSL